MGVQVWYRRTAAAVSGDEQTAVQIGDVEAALDEAAMSEIVVAEPPSADPQATEAALPIAFDWLASEHAFVLYPAQAGSRAYLQFLRDVLVSIDWLGGSRDAKPSLQRGEFRWPQVTSDGVGTPDRSLQAFAEKYGLGERRVGFAPELTPEIERWGSLLDAQLVELPVGPSAMGDPEAKAKLWSTLVAR